MPRQDFVDGLRALGFNVTDHGNGRVSFPYVIPVGKYTGKEILLGFEVNDDWPLNPPHGPHITPELLPRGSGGGHPTGGIHPSNFGPNWQHWSRPYQNWQRTNRTVREYMAFIRTLFDTQ